MSGSREATRTANVPSVPASLALGMLGFVEGLFECLPRVFYFEKDHLGRFTGGNDGFVEMLRAPNRQMILGKTDLDFFPPHIARGYQEDDRLVMRTSRPLLHKLEVVPRDDLSLNWHEVNKFPIRDAAGMVIGVAGITFPVSRDYGAHLVDPSLVPVLDHISQHYGDRIRVDDLARLARLSSRTLERRFHDRFQTSPLRYLKQVRINAACHALSHTAKSIADIAYECGFCDQAHLTGEFRQIVGTTPLKYRNGRNRN